MSGFQKTEDGLTYEHIGNFDVGADKPNEATIRFSSNNKMYMLIRCDGATRNGLLGVSYPPYREWIWVNIGRHLAGPNFIFLPNGRICIGTRIYRTKEKGGLKTGIFLTDINANIDKIINLPGGGDNGYPGLLFYRNKLLISYYSSHEGKASIYFSNIKMSELNY